MNDIQPHGNVDRTHATPEVVDLVTTLFKDKSTRDVDRTMTHFSQEFLAYTDTTIGDNYRDWPSQKGAFTQFMTKWAPGTRSYPTRIVGDATSAIVVFVDSPEMFGREVRIMAPVDLRGGKVVRQVDYWDGRQFGVAALQEHRFPADQIPEDLGESAVGEQAHGALQRTVQSLSGALSAGNCADATALFATDAVLEDLTLRTAIVGATAIGTYLQRALAALPYGPGTRLRHAVGSAQGGGYEWTSDGAVRNGVTALELDEAGQITRFTAMWDGSRLETAEITSLVGYVVNE